MRADRPTHHPSTRRSAFAGGTTSLTGPHLPQAFTTWRGWGNAARDGFGALRASGRYKPSANEAVAINERGQVLGGSFVWQNGKLTRLPGLGGREIVSTAINNHDHIVGSATTAGGKGHAVLWTLKPGS